MVTQLGCERTDIKSEDATQALGLSSGHSGRLDCASTPLVRRVGLGAHVGLLCVL